MNGVLGHSSTTEVFFGGDRVSLNEVDFLVTRGLEFFDEVAESRAVVVGLIFFSCCA